MRLVATRHAVDGGFITFAAEFDSPGGTIGRCPGNALVLPVETDSMSRLQAIVKVDGDDCYLVNMSGMTDVRVNGRRIQPLHQVRLDAGDEIDIGPYTLRSEGCGA